MLQQEENNVATSMKGMVSYIPVKVKTWKDQGNYDI